MIIETISLGKGVAIGLNFEMQHAPLLVIRAGRGFVMCGYLDMAMADKLGDVACKVRGVSSFDDVLGAPIVEVSKAADDCGIISGMSGREALERMF